MRADRPTGWTLLEILVVAALLSVLAVFAVSRFVDLSQAAKIASVQASLDAMREGIRGFYLEQTLAGSWRYPTLAELGDGSGGSQIMASQRLPDNALDLDGNPANVVDATGQPRGTVIGATGGWAYRPETGEIWANTDTEGVHENLF